MPDEVTKTEEEWRQDLTPEQYDVLRRKGTEPPFTGTYVHVKDKAAAMATLDRGEARGR